MSKQVRYLILFNERTFWLSCQLVQVNRCCFSLFRVFVYVLTKWDAATIPKVQLWLFFVHWIPYRMPCEGVTTAGNFMYLFIRRWCRPRWRTHWEIRVRLQTQRRLSWTKNGGRCFRRPSIKATCLGLLPMKPMLFLNGMLTSVVVVWIYYAFNYHIQLLQQYDLSCTNFLLQTFTTCFKTSCIGGLGL